MTLKSKILLKLAILCLIFQNTFALVPPAGINPDISIEHFKTGSETVPIGFSRQEADKWNSLSLYKKLEILCVIDINPQQYPWLDADWTRLYKLICYYKTRISELTEAIEDQIGTPVTFEVKDMLQSFFGVKDHFMFGNVIRKIYFGSNNPHVNSTVIRINRGFINTASTGIKDTIIDIFRENIAFLGWDKAFTDYFGKHFNYQGAFKIIDVVDYSIGSGVYKLRIEFSDKDDNAFVELFIKRQHAMSYDLRDEIMYLHCQDELFSDTSIDNRLYYHEDLDDPNNSLFIAPVIPGSSLDRILQERVDQKDADSIQDIVFELVKHAALGDILGREDRKLSNCHIVLDKSGYVLNLIGYDAPGLLNAKVERSFSWLVEDVRRGVSELTLVSLLDAFNEQKNQLSQRLKILNIWKKQYLKAWEFLSDRDQRKTIEDVINRVYVHDPDTAEEKLRVLHARLSKDPEQLIEKMFHAFMLDYQTRRLYQRYLGKVKESKSLHALGELHKYSIPGEDAYCASRIESFRAALSSYFMEERNIIGKQSTKEIFLKIEECVALHIGNNMLAELQEETKKIREDAEILLNECFPTDLKDLSNINAVSEEVRQIVQHALKEDLGTKGDITSDTVYKKDVQKKAIIEAQGEGILAGLKIAMLVFNMVDKDLKLTPHAKDGTFLKPGDTILIIEGSAQSIAKAERTALNFLSMLSGIATITNHFVSKTKGTHTKILDTRKTIPLLRSLSKYAVTVGGGVNHRMGLYDAVMIKDTHITEPGDIRRAVTNVRKKHPGIFIEVETATFEQIKEALECKVDRIMLDNMNVEDMRKAVAIVHASPLYIDNKPELEASGGVTLEKVHEIAKTGVDFISVGIITNAPPRVDMHLVMNDMVVSTEEILRAN